MRNKYSFRLKEIFHLIFALLFIILGTREQAQAGNVANGHFGVSGSVSWHISSYDSTKIANANFSIGRVTYISNNPLGRLLVVKLVASKQSFSLLDSNPGAFNFITLAWSTGPYFSSKGSYVSNFQRSLKTYDNTSNANISGTYNVGIIVVDEFNVISYYGAVASRTFINSGGGGSGSSGGGGGDINMSGTMKWSISGDTVTIEVGRVDNDRSSGTSGTLRLRLWATTSPYSGGSMSGYILGTSSLGQLQANYYFSNVKRNAAYKAPPPGTYYTTITLEEYTGVSSNGGYSIRDYHTFSSTRTFGSVGGSGGGGGDGIYPRFGSGSAKWKANMRRKRVTLTIPQLRNYSLTRTTGSLRVYLLGHKKTKVYRGSGKVLGISYYSYLRPGNMEYYPARRTTVRMYKPPKGRIRTALVLAEYNGRSYVTRDVRRFSKRVKLR